MFTTEFLLTTLIVVVMPGTGVIYTVSNGMARGWRAGVAAAIGCTFGILPHLLAGALGQRQVVLSGAPTCPRAAHVEVVEVSG